MCIFSIHTQNTQFPSLSERSSFLTTQDIEDYEPEQITVSISFREKFLPDGKITDT